MNRCMKHSNIPLVHITPNVKFETFLFILNVTTVENSFRNILCIVTIFIFNL